MTQHKNPSPESYSPAPVPMVLFCPACGLQHIDRPNPAIGWANPPHRSHECQGCGYTWRPADIPTTGVQALATQGRRDSPRGREGSKWFFLPWDHSPLDGWSICGMNHYYLRDNQAAGRHLFVAMSKAGRIIQAEGSVEIGVFFELRKKAQQMNELIEKEKRA